MALNTGMKFCVSAVVLCGFVTTAMANDAELINADAPITYKGDTPFSSNQMPLTSPKPYDPGKPVAVKEAPLTSKNSAPKKSAEVNMPEALDNIDRQLHMHMRVGKPYRVAGVTYTPKHNPDYDKVGEASWYGKKFHGKPTASGEKFDRMAMTAAHPTLPFNSRVRVTDLRSGKSIYVRINDRGPFLKGRLIDLSEAAAAQLGYKELGLGLVRVEYAGPAKRASKAQKSTELKAAPQGRDIKPKAPVTSPPKTQSYKPLRELQNKLQNTPKAAQVGEYLAPKMDIPKIIAPVAGDGPLEFKAPASPQLTPEAEAYLPPQYKIPEAAAPQSEDGVVTLTIKGPIHMAKSSSSDEPPAVINTVYRSEK